MRERERVQAAYDRRVDDDRYAPLRPDVVASQAARTGSWASALFGSGHELGAFLDVGCGWGDVLAWAAGAGAAPVIGVDLLEGRLGPWPWSAPLGGRAVADGAALPFPDATFQTVSCSTVFSSILDDAVAAAVAAEITRVLVPGGAVLWFDLVLPNPRNRDVRPVSHRTLARLFPAARQDLRRSVLVPPVARRLAGHPLASSLLATMAPLRSHLAGALWLP